mgnify:CR=1 FL=1
MFPVDAGASPEWACVLAAIHSLDGRASATEPGVRSVYPPQIYPGDAFVLAVVVAEGVEDFGQVARLCFGK